MCIRDRFIVVVKSVQQAKKIFHNNNTITKVKKNIRLFRIKLIHDLHYDSLDNHPAFVCSYRLIQFPIQFLKGGYKITKWNKRTSPGKKISFINFSSWLKLKIPENLILFSNPFFWESKSLFLEFLLYSLEFLWITWEMLRASFFLWKRY